MNNFNGTIAPPGGMVRRPDTEIDTFGDSGTPLLGWCCLVSACAWLITPFPPHPRLHGADFRSFDLVRSRFI